MAPQRETTGLADRESTYYGALELKSEQTATGRMKYVAGLAFVAVAVTAAALAFAPAARTSVMTTVNESPPGDDLSAEGGDCMCEENVACAPVAGEYYGECTALASSADDCIGFDYTEKYTNAAGDVKVHCQITEGLYDCYTFPCVNGGFCVDGANTYTCVCPFGYEGKDCELQIDECSAVADDKVCHEYATCADAEGSYSCECNPGFFGDGYATDQDAIKWGSILTSADNSYGWLDRDGDYGDNNQDGVTDRFGCTDINDCSSTPCFNGGRCLDLWDGHYSDGDSDDYLTLEAQAQAQSNSFECDCTVTLPDTRFAGDYCELDVDECDAALHNCDKEDRSDCTNTEGSFSCECREFWEGDGYSPLTNSTDWGCTEASGCDNYEGYEGCQDIDDCIVRTFSIDDSGAQQVDEASPCQNGGTCTNDGLGTGEYFCFCVVGWRGHDCEVDINECEELDAAALQCDANAYCSNTPGSWTCLCNNGWTGDGNLDGGCYDADDCEFSPCQHGGTCTDCGTLCYICDCVVGWRGKSCETDWNECVMGIHTCHEFAMCVNVPGSFECECEPGYSGDGYEMCIEVNDCNRYADDDDMNDETLVDYGKRVYGADGALDADASEGLIENATWMDDYPIACGANSWTCFDDAGDALTGAVHQCGEFDPIAKIFRSHGACEDVGAAAFICTCMEGWSDSNCDLDIDECARATDTCNKYAVCTNTDGSYTCSCNNGFSGDGFGTCHDVDDCTVGNEKCDKGFCTDLGVGDFRCTCDGGYTDRLCDTDIDECSSMTHTCYVNNEQCFTTEQCMNGSKRNDQGELESGLPQWSDACKMNSAGDLVYTPCDTLPKMCKVLVWKDDAKTVAKMCMNDYKNAVCTNTNGSFKCACRAGFIGDGIGNEGCSDIDECGSAPCENGTCDDDGPLAYACQCDEGWTDTNCDHDVNECLTRAHDCHPDGKCVNVPGAYYCRCKSGATGDGYTCTDLDDCDPDPCDPVHGVCTDEGANRYGCICTNGPNYDYDALGPYAGFLPPDCATPADECTMETHTCDPNADCYDVYGSYMCECKEGFYGDGVGPDDGCAPCTVCHKFCPSHQEAGVFALEMSQNVDETLGACGSENWIYTGYKEDTRMPPCESVDRTCINVDECSKLDPPLIANCDAEASCSDNPGSFTCQCEGEYWGTGVEDECYECTICGKGEYMKNDCTTSSDRQCEVTIPDGNYAMQTDSGSVSQCLVHWKEPGQIYPERYSWGGRATTSTEGADEMGAASATQSYGSNWNADKDHAVKPAPDYCQNPVCGVCDWNDEDPKDNLVKGMETVWTFKRLEKDLYLILNAADGNGFRCLGFEVPDAPYPTLIAWKDTQMEAAEGTCNGTDTVCSTATDCMTMTITISAGLDAAVVAGATFEQSSTSIPRGNGEAKVSTARAAFTADFAAGATSVTVTFTSGSIVDSDDLAGTEGITIEDVAYAGTVTGVATNYDDVNADCVKEDLIVGEWVTDKDGVQSDDLEKCEVNRAGLPTNCKLDYFCGFETNSNGAAFDKMVSNGGTVWNVKQLGCTMDGERRWLCQRNPVYENKFMVRSLAGQDANRDNSITELDYECLFFPQIAGGQYTHPRRAPRAPSDDGVWGGLAADADGNGDNECGILPTTADETQEQRLVANKQATWTLIPLPDY